MTAYLGGFSRYAIPSGRELWAVITAAYKPLFHIIQYASETDKPNTASHSGREETE